MHNEIHSDIPNENGTVSLEKTEQFERLIQRVENRVWMIVDAGRQLEIMGDKITVMIPVNALNVVTNAIERLSDGQGLVRFQTNDGRNVSNIVMSYNSYDRAEAALESLTDFLRNKNQYISEEVYDRTKQTSVINETVKNKEMKNKNDKILDNHRLFSNEPAASYSDYRSVAKVKDTREIKWDDVKNEGEYWSKQFEEEKPSLFRKFINLFKK